MVGEAKVPTVGQDRAQRLLALEIAALRQVAPVDAQQVEREHHQVRAAALDPRLQRRKARATLCIKRDDFTVDQRAEPTSKRFRRLDHGRKLVAPVEPGAREHLGARRLATATSAR